MWVGYICGGDEAFWENAELLQCRDCVASLLAVPVYCCLGMYLVATRNQCCRPEGLNYKLITTCLLIQASLPLFIFFGTRSLTFGDWLGWSSSIVFWATMFVTWQGASLQSACLLVMAARIPSTWASAARLPGGWDMPSFIHLAESALCLLLFCLLTNRSDAAVSLPSKWLFMWAGQLLNLGAKRVIEIDDTLDPQLDMKETQHSFEVHLLTHAFDVRRALFLTFRGSYLMVGFYRLLVGLSVFCFPLLLRSFLDYLTMDGATWKGSLYVIGLSLVVVIPAVLREYQEYQARLLMLKIRDVLLALVNKQTFRLPEAVRQKAVRATSTTFLISTDCSNITELPRVTFEIPVKLAQICLGFYLLYLQVDWAFLTGIGVVLLILAANTQAAFYVLKESRDINIKSETRVRKVSSLLGNMSALKCQGWTNLGKEMVQDARITELAALQRRQYCDALCAFLWYTTPVWVSLCIFLSYRGFYESNALSPARVVSSLVLFDLLIHPLNVLPYDITRRSEIDRSVNAVEGYLSIPPVRADITCPVGICIEAKGTFSWSDVCTQVSSTTISITLKSGEYVGVIGRKGSGKSSFLWALAGEMLQESGVYSRKGSIAFAPSTPCVFSGSVYDNILVGKAYDEKLFLEVTDAVSLEKCFADCNVIVSPEDPTLRTAQAAKICLARCLYMCADLLLLDDPYQHLDEMEASCLHEYLSAHRNTVVVATRNFRLLRDCTTIIEMTSGEHCTAEPSAILEEISDTIRQSVVAAALLLAATCNTSEHHVAATPTRSWDGECQLERYTNTAVDIPEQPRVVMKGTWTLICQETGKLTAGLVVGALIVMQGTHVFADWWVCHWIDSDSYSDWTYLFVLGVVAVGHAGAALCKCIVHAYGGIKLSELLHTLLLDSIMSAPVAFFKANHVASLLTCLSDDVSVIDEDLPLHLGELATQSFRLLGAVCVLGLFNLYTLFGVIPVVVLFVIVRQYFEETMRELKRLDFETSTKLQAHNDEISTGVASLKVNVGYVLQMCEDVLAQSQRVKYSICAVSCWLRLRLQLAGYVCVTVCSTVAVANHKHGDRHVALAGLALFYSYSITQWMGSLVTTVSELQATLLSVQRVNEYSMLKSDIIDEGPYRPKLYPKTGRVTFQQVSVSIGSPSGTCKQWCSYPKAFDGILCRHGGEIPGDHWSCCGSTSEKGKCMPLFTKHIHPHTGEWRQRALHQTLSNVNFQISPGHRVALVGKSGSGKTTLMELLLNLQEPSGGVITLDGKTYDKLSTKCIRQAVALLGQVPLLLDGTIHMNLDPTGQYSRNMCLAALRSVQLEGYPLHYDIGERGRRLSDAEKQLLCVARIVLRGMAREEYKKVPPLRLILMDNALCHCSVQVEKMVHRVLKEWFRRATVVVVTNKLDVVTESDSMLVLRDGIVVEDRDVCDTMLHQIFQVSADRDILQKTEGSVGSPSSRKPPSSHASQSSFDFRRSLGAEDAASLNFSPNTDPTSTVDPLFGTTKRTKARQHLRF
eukprot:TRINITY_DN17337_c0_g1_i1.p1 TRINITY_DN17337_c0_g1~~TRINITY_DN17337_c0_g1_i1.p1  ORF type:complete len:1502 (+),score=269.77 TRINITY_DN17337_c0_g1_i1:48-4553(+)